MTIITAHFLWICTVLVLAIIVECACVFGVSRYEKRMYDKKDKEVV